MRESSYVRSRRTTACGGTVFRHAEANGPGGTAQVVGTWVIRPGSDWNVGWQRIPGMLAIWPNGGRFFLGGSFAAIRWRHHLQVLHILFTR